MLLDLIFLLLDAGVLASTDGTCATLSDVAASGAVPSDAKSSTATASDVAASNATASDEPECV